MADTNHSHAHSHAGTIPVEGDGISYRGIVWFVVVLVVTTLVSQGLMYGLLRFMQHEADTNGVKRSPLAVPAGQQPPAPNLVTDEPSNLKTFQEAEDKKLSAYSWIDQSAGTVRIPIDRAKELLLERGLPVGAPSAAPATAAAAQPGK